VQNGGKKEIISDATLNRDSQPRLSMGKSFVEEVTGGLGKKLRGGYDNFLGKNVEAILKSFVLKRR